MAAALPALVLGWGGVVAHKSCSSYAAKRQANVHAYLWRMHAKDAAQNGRVRDFFSLTQTTSNERGWFGKEGDEVVNGGDGGSYLNGRH